MSRGDLAREMQQLFEGPTVAKAGVYTLLRRFELEAAVAFVGFSPDGTGAVLVPMPRAAGARTDRRTSGLVIRTPQEVSFEFQGRSWSESACVLECVDQDLKRSFAILAAGLLSEIGSGHTASWADVLAAFSDWERLLRRRRSLGREDELGLWGELALLAWSPQLEQLFAAWRGPEAGVTDFYVDGVAFDVKATLRPGSVHVSHAQLTGSGSKSFLVVIDAVVDPVAGSSVAELVRDLGARIEDPVEFEEKLLAVGLTISDAASYERRYVCRRDPTVYRTKDVPQVRVADPGVSDLRYRVDLDPRTAVTKSDVESILPFLSFPTGSKDHDAPR